MQRIVTSNRSMSDRGIERFETARSISRRRRTRWQSWVMAALIVLALTALTLIGWRHKRSAPACVPPVARESIPVSAPVHDGIASPAVWQCFVIDGESLKPYDGRTSVRMQALGTDVVEIVVDAFPRPPKAR